MVEFLYSRTHISLNTSRIVAFFDFRIFDFLGFLDCQIFNLMDLWIFGFLHSWILSFRISNFQARKLLIQELLLSWVPGCSDFYYFSDFLILGLLNGWIFRSQIFFILGFLVILKFLDFQIF